MKSKKHRVVYIPGLGDGSDPGRRLALKTWRLYGLQAELVPMDWDDEKDYHPKYDRVMRAIDRALKHGSEVSIVADSAGASLALNVFADRPDIHRVVTICGVSSPTIKLIEPVKQRAPALQASVEHLADAFKRIDKRSVVSLRSLADRVIEDRYTYIDGATNYRLPMIGHIPAITYAITIGAVQIARIIKKT